MKKLIKVKTIRLIKLHTICKLLGHKETPTMYHNGFKRGTALTARSIPLYQMKCPRCNRFFGDKEKL